MHRVPLETAQQIAIIRRNGLGDLLCTMPLLSYCRRVAPQAQITLFVDRRNSALVPYLQGFDRCVVLPRGNKYWAAFHTGITHWHPRFDIAIAAKPTPMKLLNFSLWAMRAKHRLAVVDHSWHARLVNCPVPAEELPHRSMHQALALLKMVCPGMKSVDPDLYPRLKVKDSTYARPASQAPLILISVTNNREYSWPGITGYREILNRLAQKNEFRVAISCEPRDSANAYALAANLKAPSIVMPSRHLGELIATLGEVDMAFIGDGGLMHIAAALDVPQLALFARTDPTHWHPLSRKAVWLSDESHVRNISQDAILEALQKQLDSAATCLACRA